MRQMQHVIGNNERILTLLSLCDQRGDTARNNLHLNTIEPYLAAIERVYINVKGDLLAEDKITCDKLNSKYYNIKFLIETDENTRTTKALRDMLKVCIEFNATLINSLGNINFFGNNRKEPKQMQFYEGKYDIKGKTK